MPVHMRIVGDEEQQAEKESSAIRADLLHTFQQLCVQLNGRSHRLLHSTRITPLQLGVLRYIRQHDGPPGLTTLSDAFQPHAHHDAGCTHAGEEGVFAEAD